MNKTTVFALSLRVAASAITALATEKPAGWDQTGKGTKTDGTTCTRPWKH
jgi:hypothetical protein